MLEPLLVAMFNPTIGASPPSTAHEAAVALARPPADVEAVLKRLVRGGVLVSDGGRYTWRSRNTPR